MTTLCTSPVSTPENRSTLRPTDPSISQIVQAIALALLFVFLTRFPVARPYAVESDEFGFLAQIRTHWFPMHHTLFLTLGRALGELTGQAYLGFLVLDMITSAVALVSVWWWLRALVSPSMAAAGTLLLSVGPIFWGYGAMAGNYTLIVAVGAFLLGVAYRGKSRRVAWHPYAAAVALAFGTGYRQDIGTFWLPVFLVILWQHRWRPAFVAGTLFTVLNLAWLLTMFQEAGGWSNYRAQTADFAYSSGYLNSIFALGVIDAPVRYGVKLGMAILWTLGPCVLFIPRGFLRLRSMSDGRFLTFLMIACTLPALGSHLLVHFGVPGYSFHYLPALLALVVIGIRPRDTGRESPELQRLSWLLEVSRRPTARLLGAAALMSGVFLFYPTNYEHPGWRGSFDLSFARHTRIGLRTPTPNRQPMVWRTANSRDLAGTKATSRATMTPPL
jgi:hypothetical protein